MFYQKSDFDKIIEEIKKPFPENKRDDFEERLSEYAMTFIQSFAAEKSDPPSKIIKRLQDIEKAAKKLIKLTKSPDGSSAVVRLNRSAARYKKICVTSQTQLSNGQLETITRSNDFTDVVTVIKAIKDLELYAHAALTDENKKVSPDKKRHKGRKARQHFVNDLAGLWSDIFNELPGASLDPDTGDVGGPFIRFILACHKPLQNEFPMLPELNETSALHHYRASPIPKLKRLVK